MGRARCPNVYKPTRALPLINRLRQERILAGLTQRDLAEILGYSNQHLYYLESGRLHPQILYLLYNYADYLGYEIALIPKSRQDETNR